MTGDRRHEQDRRRREEDFVQGVLGRTSGSPCEKAAGMLPDLADGELEDFDRRLVTAHLEHCAECRAVAVTLGWLGPELPKMAELDPGPRFLQAVLDRTSRAAPGIAAGPVRVPTGFGPAGWMDRLGRWWGERILRPLFPVQVAYAATLVIVLLTATPFSPLRGAPRQALESIQAQAGALNLVGPALDSTLDASGRRLAGTVDGALDLAGAAWTERVRRSAPARGELKTNLEEFYGHLRRGNAGGAVSELPDVWEGVRESWNHWWRTAQAAPSRNSNPQIPDPNESERSTP